MVSPDFPVGSVTMIFTIQTFETDAFQSDKDAVNNYSKAVNHNPEHFWTI